MVDQVYGETWLTSMVEVRSHDHEPCLGLRLGFWEAVEAAIGIFRLRVFLQG